MLGLDGGWRSGCQSFTIGIGGDGGSERRTAGALYVVWLRIYTAGISTMAGMSPSVPLLIRLIQSCFAELVLVLFRLISTMVLVKSFPLATITNLHPTLFNYSRDFSAESQLDFALARIQ